MKSLLYGTYLTFRIKELFEQTSEPLSVRQIAEALARLPERESYNLRRRVRKSLKHLLFEQVLVEAEPQRENNLIVHTYQINAHGLSESIQGADRS